MELLKWRQRTVLIADCWPGEDSHWGLRRGGSVALCEPSVRQQSAISTVRCQRCVLTKKIVPLRLISEGKNT